MQEMRALNQSIDLLNVNRVRLSRSTALNELRRDIVRASYMAGSFTLSGLHRDFYFDKYLFETRPALLRRVGRFLGELVHLGSDRLAAPALGAVALGTAVSLDLGMPLVIVRPEATGEPAQAIKGELYPGETVTLIEDVVVTGDRAFSALERIEEAGARGATVVAVVDRNEGARERFVDAAVEYRFLFEPDDLGVGGHGG
jgi:orotate phosphoribosyltransferase